MPSTELSEACPWEGPNPGRLSLGTFPWRTSFPSYAHGSQKLESDLDLLLQVLVVSFHSAVGQLWGPSSLGTSCLHLC